MVHGVHISNKGDSIFVNKVEGYKSEIVVLDRATKLVINEFTNFTEGDPLQRPYLDQNYGKIPISKNGSLLVLRDPKLRLVCYKLDSQTVNASNGKDVMNWFDNLRSIGTMVNAKVD